MGEKGSRHRLSMSGEWCIFASMEIPSQLIQDAVEALSKLPGVGQKTALRLALHLLQQDAQITENISNSLKNMREKVSYCSECHFVCEQELCEICANRARTTDTICVVESIRDVLAIENTGQYYGKYHVLGGLIAPLKGYGPDDLDIDKLIQRLKKYETKEIIFALSPTVEGDTTAYYISQKAKDLEVDISSLARGVAFGGELEYTDDLTLARSLTNRLPFQKYVNED